LEVKHLNESVKWFAPLLIAFFILATNSALAQSKYDLVKQVRFERGASGATIIGVQTQSDSALVAALREEYSGDDYGELRYFLKWFDLNGDGEPEAIVHVVGPRVCGTGGCPTTIFVRREGSYKPVSTIVLTRPLIIASQRRTHGWRNLIVFLAGGGIMHGYYVELPFDGSAYPESASDKLAKEVKGQPQGVVLIRGFSSYLEGKSLKPQGGSDKR